MRGTRCLYSTRQALFRVFVSSSLPSARSEALAMPFRQLPLCATSDATLQLPRSPALQTRSYAKKVKPSQAAVAEFEDPKDVPYDVRYTTQRSFEQSGKSRLPIDFEITDPKVMVIDISGGAPEGPLDPKFILSRIDPTIESLRMIKPYVPAKSKAPAQLPICKVVNKKEEMDRQRAAKEKKKENAAPKQKDLELGWAITDHDLGFKTKQVVSFLSKGMMVNVMFGRKKGSKPTEEKRCREVVEFVTEEALRAGGRERKKGEGQLGKNFKISLQGRQVKKEDGEGEGSDGGSKKETQDKAKEGDGAEQRETVV